MTFGLLMLFQGTLAFDAFVTDLSIGIVEFFARGPPSRNALRRLFPCLPLAGVPLNIAYARSLVEFRALQQGLPLLAGFGGIALGGSLLAAAYLHMTLVLKECARLPGALMPAGQNALSVYILQALSQALCSEGMA